MVHLDRHYLIFGRKIMYIFKIEHLNLIFPTHEILQSTKDGKIKNLLL